MWFGSVTVREGHSWRPEDHMWVQVTQPAWATTHRHLTRGWHRHPTHKQFQTWLWCSQKFTGKLNTPKARREQRNPRLRGVIWNAEFRRAGSPHTAHPACVPCITSPKPTAASAVLSNVCLQIKCILAICNKKRLIYSVWQKKKKTPHTIYRFW